MPNYGGMDCFDMPDDAAETSADPERAPAASPTSRSCCTGSCIRKNIANPLDPGSAIEERLCVLAAAVARTCGSLDPQELEFCVTRLFDVPPECDLTKLFVAAYQTERDALEGRRDIDAQRTSDPS